MKILIDEFLAQCASDAKDMFLRQLKGHSWDEIGKSYGMSAHAAQERVRYVFQQVREKLKI